MNNVRKFKIFKYKIIRIPIQKKSANFLDKINEANILDLS